MPSCPDGDDNADDDDDDNDDDDDDDCASVFIKSVAEMSFSLSYLLSNCISYCTESA